MRLARADPARFAPIYERYFRRIYAYCWRRVDSEVEAEDLTSQVFTRALGALPGYRGGRVVAWLFRIAHNVVANHYRARSRRSQVSLEAISFDPTDDRPGPGQQVVEAEEWQALRALVAGLPDDRRELLALKVTGGLTAKEIGEIVDRSPGAVRVELHRIIKELRAQHCAVYDRPEGER